MAASPQLSRFNISPGTDFELLWKRLEDEMLKLRANYGEQICVADSIEKIKVLQGAWGAYGFVYNKMQEMMIESRGEKKTDLNDEESLT